MSTVTKRCCTLVLTVFMYCLFPVDLSAQVNLWTFGTQIDPGDGNIEFYQTWNNAHNDFYVHDITYSSDGLHVKGWILVPKSSGPHPVLIWNRGGSGPQGDIKWYQNDGTDLLYKQELFPYVSAGYVVVSTQYRYNGKKVALTNDTRYIPTYPPTESHYASGSDPFVESGDKDYRGGAEVNDVINLLPLIQKLTSTSGNGGLKIDLDVSRIAMMGMSRGGMETYIALRELSESTKYGTLPAIKCAIVKGAISHWPDWLKDIFEEKTVWHEMYGSKTTVSHVGGAKVAGNFSWVYPDDYDDPGDPGHSFWSFFPDSGPFPTWDDTDLTNDDWPESGLVSPPYYPYSLIYSEEYYYRSAVLWDNFWSQNEIPLLILHGRGDTQVLWQDAQDVYSKMVSVGESSLYTLKLFDDSDNDCSACAFLGSDLAKKAHCDHWLIEYDYGRDDVLSWLTKHLDSMSWPMFLPAIIGNSSK